MTSAVELSALTKSYGATPVVKGISLRLEAGGLMALLGPSGCGKTTTLRMIAGLETPNSGVISLGNTVVDGPGVHLAPEKRGVGMVFQSYAVWPHRTVAENVDYPLRLKGHGRAERTERVAQALDWVRLTGLGDRLPQQLSGGQLQRVALARALVANPTVLLLDEPLSNLDLALRDELRGEIAALRARLGTTMVLVTHDQGEALALADQVAVMNRGHIEQLASPHDIHHEPATPFVAGFVGRANLLEGRREAGRFVVAGLGGGVTFDLPDAAKGPEETGVLAVRPEDVALDDAAAGTGTALPLSAVLFAGSHCEYRFSAGETVLRALGPPRGAKPGASLRLRLVQARFYPSLHK